MYNGAESFEHINACHQERVRQVDRTARELEVQRLLSPCNSDTGSDLGSVRISGFMNRLIDTLRPRRRMELPSS